MLTIGTDSPAYEPWFVDNDPTNGKGFESAVAYAVAEELGFAKDEVKWIKVGFNSPAKPGAKDFDFDINQISITPERDEVVDFSEGYYSAAQAVIALKGSAAAEATSLEDLKGLQARRPDRYHVADRDPRRHPARPGPAVFEDTNVAKQALQNGQARRDRRRPADRVLHQRRRDPGRARSSVSSSSRPAQQEEFGMLFEQGSELLPCVNLALETLKEDGTLDAASSSSGSPTS